MSAAIRKHTLLIVLCSLPLLVGSSHLLVAQTNISGDIAGTITDPTGAVVPGAQVQVSNPSAGINKTAVSDASGNYRVPLLSPGDYTITATAQGFAATNTHITVSAGRVNAGDIKLAAGSTREVVTVTEAAPLLHTEDAQISTSFTMEQVQALPNPGNDLTFIAQTSPGAVMNTQGGFGNFSVFGLPATSNTFTVNGGYYNDPFLNLNNSGSTNLLLGNNDIADVTVISNAYDAAFGGLGGAQINEISRSGSNAFHGNATYWWNGSALNANDWFNNATGSPRPFDNVNQWAGAIGGPVVKDKLFWFFNTEGIRIIIPSRTPVYAPSAATQMAIEGSTPYIGPMAPSGNLAYNGNAAEIPFYTALLNLYANAPGFSSATPDPNDPNVVIFNGQATNFTHEALYTGRVDWAASANDHAFLHFEYDNGFQATSTSVLSPIFNAGSNQPEYIGQFQETHTFSPALTNQFLAAFEYYQAIFQNVDPAAANAVSPFTLIFANLPASYGTQATDLANNALSALPGNINGVFPQGRNVTNYQFADDLSWTRGNHTIKLGWAMRRDDVSDYDPGINTIPAAVVTFNSFAAGNVDELTGLNAAPAGVNFPSRPSQPIALYNMSAYVQDQWKAMPNLTVTVGLRLEHNSNPTCLTNCFATSAGDFYSLPTATDTPFNQLLDSGRRRAFPDLQKVGFEPRVGIAWLPFGPGSHTTVRGGYGMFVDTFPATVADAMLNNLPISVALNAYSGTIFGGGPNSAPTYQLDPAITTSGYATLAAQAAAIHSCFAVGCSSDTAFGTTPALITPAPKVNYPTYNEYSLAVEQQFDRKTAGSVMYVGNHGYHEPVVNSGANAFAPPGSNFFGLPTAPPNPNFSKSTIIYAGASSNYNGMIANVTRRERYLTLTVNYAYSHALDEISNGGFLPFSPVATLSIINPYNLSQNYGNAEYDVRHYISGSYVFTLPYMGGPHLLTDGWQVAGTVFHNTGMPFSVVDAQTGGGLPYGGTPLADQLNYDFPTKCGGSSHTYIAGTPCAFGAPGGSSAGLANYALATNYGQQTRDQLRGPNFTDTDLDLSKGFTIPGWESAQIRLGAQFFNLFNHPNFALPVNSTGSGNLGEIENLVSTPTSILGSALGGDAAPRLIQLKASFVF